MIRFILLVVAGVLLSAPAIAGTDSFTACGTNRSESNVGGSSCISYELTNSSATAAPVVYCQSESCIICLNSDTTAATVGATRVSVEYCAPSAPASANLCGAIAAALDGTPGATQNMCKQVGRGTYRLDITAIPAAGEEATLWVRGY